MPNWEIATKEVFSLLQLMPDYTATACVWKWRWGDKKRVWKEEEEKMVLEFSPSPLEGASRRVVTFYAHLLLQGASAQGGGGGILLTAS